jgi:hypothetical protein
MTISSSGPISLSDIATEYDLSLNNLDLNRVSNIARLPASRDLGSFRGTSSNDFTGNTGYYERVTGVADANINGLAGSLGSVRALVNMSDATTGVIFEVGASGIGFVLYVHSGTIYAQYGDGDVVGGDYEVSYTVPSTWTTDETHEIVVSCDSRGYGLARMYIDGILVSTEYNATPTALNDIAGTNDAGTGKVHSALAYTRMNPTDQSSEGSFPFTGGTIRSVSTYRQVTAIPHVQGDTFTSNTYTSGVAGSTNILDNEYRCTILTNVTIDKDRTGVIYESGADGEGLALYVHGGKLYITAGDGDVLGGTINTNWTIPEYFSINDRTEIIASAEITSTTSRAKLFVNNREVASSTGSGGNFLSGSDSAGTGQVHGTLCYTQMNPTDDSSGELLQYTGTIYDTQVYSGIFHPYAAGGTITDVTIGSDTYRIHAFTTVGTSTLVLPETRECDVLLVGGGGGGGGVTGTGASGGGGAGGLVFNSFSALQGQQYTITVGDGGTAGGDALENGGNGGNTTGFGLTAKGGGGGGGSSDGNVWLAGSAGGSGGGGGGGDANPNGAGGAATQPGTNSGVTTDAGFAGGASASQLGDCGGGGGGAGEVGDTFQGENVGNRYDIQGGDGLDMSSYFTTAFGDSGYFAGGGGAFARNDNIPRAGGLGGGGAGGSSGTANTGGGGGGRDAGVVAGAGGSGIVLIRYRI